MRRCQDHNHLVSGASCRCPCTVKESSTATGGELVSETIRDRLLASEDEPRKTHKATNNVARIQPCKTTWRQEHDSPLLKIARGDLVHKYLEMDLQLFRAAGQISLCVHE